MPLMNYSTRVDTHRTVSQITEILVRTAQVGLCRYLTVAGCRRPEVEP